MAENCLFCQIADGTIPSSLIYEDSEIVAFADLYPQAPQHVLIIPRRHILSMAELTSEDGALIGKIFVVAADIARELGLDKQGYRLVTNVGRDGGQTVLHLHFHLLGGRQLTWPPG